MSQRFEKKKAEIRAERMKRKRTDCESDRAQSKSSVDSKGLSERALRAAMIKSRFAETILKAQEKMILMDGGNKVAKERLEKKKDEIRSDVKIVKKLRQRERDAARIALENMTQVVEWNDAIQVQMEFEKLIGVPTFPVR